MYFAPAAGAATFPAAKLLANEPASPWVRQARLRGEEFTWNIPDPTYLDGRAGFDGSLYYRVVKQAELPQIGVTLDEADPEVMWRLRGNGAGSATFLSSGAYTGYQFIYQSGQILTTKVLLVGSARTGGSYEKHFYAGNAFVTFKPATVDVADTEDCTIVMANDSNGYAFYSREWE